MNINKNITFEFSENDVKEIIAEYLNTKGYEVKVDDVSFSVGSRLEGFGRNEQEVHYFKAAYVKYKEK